MTWKADPTPLPLIEALPSVGFPATEAAELRSLEPAFRIAYEGHLQIDANGWENKAKSFYAHAIARTPEALWLHVQRINLLAAMADADIHGALIDLFLVLDGKGSGLCHRLLSQAKPLLPDDLYQGLSNHLTHSGSTRNLISGSSMLASGRLGHEQLVDHQESPPNDQPDPLQTASDQLAFGQAAEAQKTLEEALLDEPDRLDLHLALLEIYHHSLDKHRINHFLQRLAGSPNPALKAWQELLDELDENND